MRAILSFIAASYITAQNLNINDAIANAFNQFNTNFGVNLQSGSSLYNQVYSSFAQNYQTVSAFQQQPQTFELGLNRFAALSDQEFRQTYLTLQPSQVDLQYAVSNGFEVNSFKNLGAFSGFNMNDFMNNANSGFNNIPWNNSNNGGWTTPSNNNSNNGGWTTPSSNDSNNGSNTTPNVTPSSDTNGNNAKPNTNTDTSGPLPSSYDSRNDNLITPVKDQGQCGCCWAFTATATIEAQYAKKYGKSVDLSEQQVLSCTGGSNSCNGGAMDSAYAYLKGSNGLGQDSSFPYKGSKVGCKSTSGVAKVVGFTKVKSDDEIMRAVYKYGAVGVGIDASKLQLFKSGIYSCRGSVALDHGVTIIGWGSNNQGNYWIVKNSWGSSWGQSGYFNLARGGNSCGVFQMASYPILG